MIKASSLIYAIYICLLVSILCGAMLCIATLSDQLDSIYKIRQDLYLQNQSAVNFSIGNDLAPKKLKEANSGALSSFIVKPYGLLKILLTTTAIRNDSVVSGYILGSIPKDDVAICVPNVNNPTSYSGNVKIAGESQLPFASLRQITLRGEKNHLDWSMNVSRSENFLPGLNQNVEKIFADAGKMGNSISRINRIKDSIYYNTFQAETLHLLMPGNILSNVVIKGNIVLRYRDSVYIKKSASLSDVIIIAPKITFERGFTGSVQAFAAKGIFLQSNVNLEYPSILCLHNTSEKNSTLEISENCVIKGALVVCGNGFADIDKNVLKLGKNDHVLGAIYCTGTSMLSGTIKGSVYTNRLFYETKASHFDNVLCNVELNALERPAYFANPDLINQRKPRYAIIKKVV